jgi:poly(3-hydroxybutyrate) depolymerase
VQRSVYFPGGGVCRAGSLVAGGWRNRVTVESPAGGGTRSFLLVLPRNYAAGVPMPLLLALHGGAAYATNFLDFSYLDSRGIDAGFAVAAPDGLPGTLRVGGVWRLQNAAGDGAGDVHPEVDDLAFIADVTRCIGALGVPLSGRMSVAGFSLGAKFANLVACAPPPGFATAAVVVAGGLQEPRPTSCHVPMLTFQGGADPQVPFCTRAANMGPMAYWPTRIHFEAWLLSNGADEALQSTQCSAACWATRCCMSTHRRGAERARCCFGVLRARTCGRARSPAARATAPTLHSTSWPIRHSRCAAMACQRAPAIRPAVLAGHGPPHRCADGMQAACMSDA